MASKKETNVCVIASEPCKRALRSFLSLFNRPDDSAKDQNFTSAIVELVGGSSYAALKSVYDLWATELQRSEAKRLSSIILLMPYAADDLSAIIRRDLGLSDDVNLTFPEKFSILDTSKINQLISAIHAPEVKDDLNADIKAFDDLALALRRARFDAHARTSDDPAHEPIKFIRHIPWNVLVIDNELDEATSDQWVAKLSKVLGWPSARFWFTTDGAEAAVNFNDVNISTFNPTSSLDPTAPGDAFFNEFKTRIYKENIDLVLLDVALGGLSLAQPTHYGFYLIEGIRNKLAELDRATVPVVMYSKYGANELIVSSVRRGADWYMTKLLRDDVPSVEHLPRTASNVYASWMWRAEYLYNYLPSCSGDVKDRIQEYLTRQREDEFIEKCDLDDRFFRTDESLSSFAYLIRAATEKNTLSEQPKINLGKLIEYHYIFRRLFSSFDHIEIIQMPGVGLSGASVFFVRPYKHELAYSVQLVKIGQHAEVGREKQNFEEWVNGMLDSFIGRIKAGPIRAERYAGLLYVAVGTKQDYEGQTPISFKELIEHFLERRPFRGESVRSENLNNFLEELFTGVLASFYKGKKKIELRVITTYLDDLPSTLEGELVGIYTGRDSLNDEAKTLHIKPDRWWLNDVDNSLDDSQTPKTAKIVRTLEDVSRVQEDDLFYFPDFEIYEINREEHKLKIHNRFQHFNALTRTKEVTEALKISRGRTDLRVDINVQKGCGLDSLFEDPRVEAGRRFTFLLHRVKKGWRKKLSFFGRGKHDPMYADYATAMAVLQREILEGGLKASGEEKHHDFAYALLDAYDRLLSEPGDGSLRATREFTTSNIHGDLNLDNILITGSGKRQIGWFIDFRRSRHGHTVYDFVKLETEIKTHILSKYLGRFIQHVSEAGGAQKSKTIETCLRWFVEFELKWKINNGQIPPEVETSFFKEDWERVTEIAKIILLIRKLAIRYELLSEYNLSLFLYSFSALKFPNLDDPEKACFPPLPKCLAYIAACCAYKKLY